MEEYTEKALSALEKAAEISGQLGHNYIGTEHILCGLLSEGSGVAFEVLKQAHVTLQSCMDLINRFVTDGKKSKTKKKDYTPLAKAVLEQSKREAERFGSFKIGTEHILIGILKNNDCVASRILNTLGINIQTLYNTILYAIGEDIPEIRDMRSAENSGRESATPTLDSFSRDLTELAACNALDPVIGRRDEISRVIQILSRRTKNNPCLIGEPGVGKTAVAEGIAHLLVLDAVPDTIRGKRLLSLDIPAMVAGTKYRGEFEERIKKVINEAGSSGNVLLFIDELHTIIGAGGAEGSLDAANILKPALARGELQIIGATTIEEYRKHIEKDSALERRFQPVMVEEPTVSQTVEILRGLKHLYEEHHGLSISDEAVTASVKLSERYINDRFLPDKAIDLLDEAASKVKISKYSGDDALNKAEDRLYTLTDQLECAVIAEDFELAKKLRKREQAQKKRIEALKNLVESEGKISDLEVSENDIADVVSEWTKIPVNRLTEEETDRIRKLEEKLHEKIVSQDEAVTAVSKAIKRGRVGIKDPRRPIGSFMFLGPTGVGKTELSKAIAESVFGSEDSLIRVDMSEYMEKHSVSKMIGSPPGYVGFDEGGQLSEKVRRNPYSVVLFDEIEKAHPDVFNILLQVLDEGHITDAQGRKVSFKNTIIIMTSNAGAENIISPKHLGFSSSNDSEKNYAEMKGRVMDEVKRLFKPEFLNRLDDIIVFRPLTRENIDTIVSIMLSDISKRIKTERNMNLFVDDSARKLFIDKGYDEKFGARPLRRALQMYAEDKIAEAILDGIISDGDDIVIAANDNGDGSFVYRKEK